MFVKKQRQRDSSGRPNKKRFIIAAEGTETEPQYFDMLDKLQNNIRINCIKAKHSSPKSVLERIKKYLEKNRLESGDEAWVVIDRDGWVDTDIDQVHKWTYEHENYGLALSNPAFEFWLLLHFEDGKKIKNTSNCEQRLKGHLSDYDKSINPNDFSKENIGQAIKRAIDLDDPPCNDWPRRIGSTTVYKLVTKIFST
jgi:hypothetical protein